MLRMKRYLFFGLVVLCCGLVDACDNSTPKTAGAPAKPAQHVALQEYEAWVDQPGKPDKRETSFSLPEKASVICFDAQEKTPPDQTGRCRVRLPSGEKALARREVVQESTAGGATLSCDGTAPLYCRIAVTH